MERENLNRCKNSVLQIVGWNGGGGKWIEVDRGGLLGAEKADRRPVWRFPMIVKIGCREHLLVVALLV